MERTTAEDRVTFTDKVALIIATGLGVGYFPWAPGTVGSFLGIIFILLLSRLKLIGGSRLLVHFLFVAMITGIGIWAASRAEIIFQRKDPPQVVVDEIVGQLLTFGLIFRNPRFVLLLMGFLFFRLFDIIKPFPIRRLERAPLGFGIVLDDLAAGFYASLIIFVAHWYWPAWA
ncbi:MAG: phosphatidylglycerophosphatase A [Acidobacteria bacterium]|nr:MAG: phosphatidylglycerophosphatase A [Acidobacteriota bacterium]